MLDGWTTLLPYFIGVSERNDLIANPQRLSAFVSKQLTLIERAWRSGAPAEAVSDATSSLRSALGDLLPPSTASARLLLVEADCRLSLGTEAQAEKAFDLADMAVAHASHRSVEVHVASLLASEAALVAGVALKALGMRALSVEYMHGVIRDLELDATAAVPLVRQEVMMTEEIVPHLRLLADAPVYRDSRPIEYFRTIKRVLEALLRDGKDAAASTLLPEAISAFGRAREEIPISSHVSFLKNLGQYFFARGQEERARSMFKLVVQAGGIYSLPYQVLQTTKMLEDLERGVNPMLRTFTIG